MPPSQFDEAKADKALYIPTEEEVEATSHDRKHIDQMYEYRAKFEENWRKAAQKWNMLAPAVEDDIPNYVVPLSRMGTYTGIVSMRQKMPEVGIIPGGIEDKKKVYFLKEAIAHVDRMTNMEAVMDQFIVDYSVLGNGVVEDYVKVPFKTVRKAIVDKDGKPTGKFKEVVRRDWSKPKIGSRARSPWECAFDPGARSHSEIRACTFEDRLSYDEFAEQFIRIGEDGPDYKNTEHVEAGFAYTFNDNSTLERMRSEYDGVVLTHYQNELLDVYRLYANGILIWDVPLSSIHRHGKITLSLVPNHHKYDRNLKTHSIYGAGDPELMEDLDDLVNAMTNMFIDNYQKKNTPVVSIEGGSLDVEEVDFRSGDVIAGKVSIQALGQADLPEFNAFKTMAEDWAVQHIKKNYKRLEGETAKTAFEAAQKQRAENVGMVYQTKRMESGGLLEHMKKRVSDVMEHMTVEEYEDILEEDINHIKEMVGTELAQEDVVYDPKTRKPLRVRFTERFRTRGKVFEEVFENGERTIDSLREVPEMKGEDGMVPAAKEYLWTREYMLFGHIPDIYLVGSAMLGEDSITELAKLERMYQHLQNIMALMQSGVDIGIDYMKLFEKTLDIVGIPKEELMESGDADKPDLKAIEQNLKDIITQQGDVQTNDNLGATGIVEEGQGQAPVDSGGNAGSTDPLLQAGVSA